MIDSIEAYENLKELSLDEFSSCFDSFQESAFRLEMLSVYSVGEEEKPYSLFKQGQIEPPQDFNIEWHQFLLEAKKNNKSISRVRVIDGLITDYIKFEVLWGFKNNVKNNEDIRFLFCSIPNFFNASVPILKDFWLFDKNKCVLMEYDYLGKFLGVKQIPNSLLNLYVKLSEEVYQKSVSFDEGLKKLKL